MLILSEKTRHLGVVLLAATVAYANVLGGGFIYDDNLQILANRWLLDPGSLPEIFSSHVWGFSPDHTLTNYYRPLMHTANLVVYTLFGPNPVAFHGLSFLLHLGCCLLLFLVAKELCLVYCPGDDNLRRYLPLYAALFFAVYPANAEAVAWAGSSGDLLYAFFTLAALLFYLCGKREKKLASIFLSVLFFACALLSKETAALTVPLLVFVVDCTTGALGSRQGIVLAVRRYLPYVVVGVAYLIVRINVLGALIPLKKYTLSGQLLLASGVQKFLWYIGKLLCPFSHNFLPELPSAASYTGGEMALGVVFLGAVLGGAFFLVWQSRVLSVAAVLIFVPLISAMQSHVLKDPVAYRYLYVPALGYCLALAWLVLRFTTWQRVRNGLVMILIIVWGTTSFAFNRDFVDAVTLWGDTVRQSPHSRVARSEYTVALFDNGRVEEGVVQAKALLQQGLNDPYIVYLLATGLQQLERFREAQGYYEQLLNMNPGYALAHAQLGRIDQVLGDIGSARARLERAARLDPQDGNIQYWLGLAYEKNGQAGKAQLAYSEALRLLPADAPERAALRGRVELIEPAGKK